ncbi:hypothetical protein [Granulicella arctica]|uniref:hypothetical protein n=1 Tax=Granulicella arctica TaxID=940613 RepID=UPI0021E0CDC1|nr:hypothetical protein [Granulicella arctica]
MVSAFVLGLALLLFPLELLAAFLGSAVLLGLMLLLRCSYAASRCVASSSVSSGAAGVMTGVGFSCSCWAKRAAARGSWMGQLLSVQTVRVVPMRLP